MGIFALEHGVNVLLEKPPAATIQDLDEMIAVERRSGKVCAVNFQNMSGTAFRRMIAMIRDGVVGRVESVTAIGIWKRTQAYYERTPWAGALMQSGEYVLDGSVHNALAHLLQNNLIAAGSGDPGAAEPLTVQAELYKGHDIESEDTACIRIETKAGPVVHYYTSLCGDSNRTPYMIVKGSDGEFRWSFSNEFTLTDAAGVPHLYEFGEENLFSNMYENLLDTLQGDAKLHCPLEACRSFLIAGNAAFVSSRGAHKIPEAHLLIGAEGDDATTEIRDLQSLFESASAQGRLLSEIGVEWAVPATPVDTRGFRRFGGLGRR
jgi:predicted dehydrogenase